MQVERSLVRGREGERARLQQPHACADAAREDLGAPLGGAHLVGVRVGVRVRVKVRVRVGARGTGRVKGLGVGIWGESRVRRCVPAAAAPRPPPASAPPRRPEGGARRSAPG